MPIKYLTQRELNYIRGKALVGHATPKELLSVFSHYDLLESKLDEADNDNDDVYGTDGWRHYFGIPDED